MFSNALGSVRRGIPTIAIAGVLVVAAATSGATAALVITGNDIKNGTVTTKDIKNDNLKSKDIKDGTLKTRDFDEATVDDLTGPAGPAGAPGVSGHQVVSVTVPIAANSTATVQTSCPAGKRVLSAAAHLAASFDGTAVDVEATTASAKARNNTVAADSLILDVVCATVS
jgi:hypothetical protein